MNQSIASTPNWTEIGLLIIAFTSIISPIIVNIINNIHDTKIKKMEFNNNVKKQVLSNFCKSVYCYYNYGKMLQDFCESLNMLYIYFDVDDNLINKIITSKYNSDDIQFKNDVSELIKKLAYQVQNK